jgi:indole-3-glycerol phosphate synthase
MHPMLDEILTHKRKEIEVFKKSGLPGDAEGPIPPVRHFKAALPRKGGIALIAEVKFASPSAGIILDGGDSVSIARIYEEAGAGAVSVLTDRRFFHGDIRSIQRVRQAISLPVLRKDFIIDPIQVEESMAVGADAILLIAGILSAGRLKELLTMARALGMACLTEVHHRHELETAIACGADIIGINNRDLTTFEVDIHTTLDLAPLIPEGCVRVSESGISNRDDIGRLRQSGIHAILVGTSLMKSRDIGAKTRELVDAGKGDDKG